MAEFTGKVHESNLDKVEQVVKKLNKRANKLGLVPLTIKVGPAIPEEDPDTHKVNVYHDVMILGESPVIAGWHLVAVINHFIDTSISEAGYTNLIRVVPGENLPESYRNSKPECDHCKHNRFRKDTIIVQHEDGTYRQVGTGCVADFLGHTNVKSFLEYAKFPEIFEKEFRGWGEPKGYYTQYTASYFLTLTSAVIRTHGWVSSAQSRESGKTATFVEVLEQIRNREKYNPKKEEIIKTVEEDVLLADGAIDWVKNLPESETSKNDYLYNCSVVIKAGMVNDKTYAITASIIPSYKRHLAKEIEAKKVKVESKYFGSVGEKFQGKVTFLFRNEYQAQRYSYYGSDVGYIYNFTTAEGYRFVWFTTNYFNLEKGEEVELKGTVKAHKEYKDTKQTVLTRCKIKE